MKRLQELPHSCWTDLENELAGTQYMTKVGIGQLSKVLVIDGGSGVNTLAENTVVAILNEQKASGVALDDKRHP